MYEHGLHRRVGEEPWRAAVRRARPGCDWRDVMRIAALVLGLILAPYAAHAHAVGETGALAVALAGVAAAVVMFALGCAPRERRVFGPRR